MNTTQRWGLSQRVCLLGWIGSFAALGMTDAVAAEDDNLPVGQFITINGAIDPATAGKIQNVALKLNKLGCPVFASESFPFIGFILPLYNLA